MDEPMPEAGPSSITQPRVDSAKKARRNKKQASRHANEDGLSTPSKSAAHGLDLKPSTPRATTTQNGVLTPKSSNKALRQMQQPGGPVNKAQLDVKQKKKQKERESHDTRFEDWVCVSIAQNQISKVPAVWSKDGRFYFSVSNTSIHIHSSVAPAFTRLSTLSSSSKGGHRKVITALALHPTNPMQILTASMDGTVKIWDWVEGRLIRTIDIAQDAHVHHLCVGQVAGVWTIFAAASLVKPGRKAQKDGFHLKHRIFRTSLVAPPVGQEATSVREFGKVSAIPAALFISPRSTYVVALVAFKAHTFRLPTTTSNDDWKATVVKFVSDQQFTCGAFCPDNAIGVNAQSEEWFATGDAKGVIRLWHGLDAAFQQLDQAATTLPMNGDDKSSNKIVYPDMEKRLPTTSLHWHAHAVSAIAFTPSGAQLLSVGEESVLVQWHLASGRREYVPRLGGRAIISLVVKTGGRGVEEEWWMTLADGAMIRVGASSGLVSSIGQGVRLDPLRPQSDTLPYPLLVHPPTKSLVLPSSHPSTLQFIDPSASSVLFDLEVAPSNRVSRRDEQELEPVSVENVAFNDAVQGCSRWMASVEGRQGDDVEGGGLVRNLKIWKWDGAKYVINTQAPRPHGSSTVSKVVFSSPKNTLSSQGAAVSHPYLLTASTDGVAKLWHVKQAKRADQGKVKRATPLFDLYWSTRSTFSYRSLPIHDAAFSPDATILALAHGSLVTLWDVESNSLLKTLSTGNDGAHQISFVGSEGRWVVALARTRGVTVWDLISCEATWSRPTPCNRLLVPSGSSTFIVAQTPSHEREETILHVFTPTNPVPLRQIVLHDKIGRLVVLPTSASSSSLQLAGVSSTGEVFRFGDDIAPAPHQRAVKVNDHAGNKAQSSIWQEMFGRDAFLEIEPVEEVPTVKKTSIGKSGRLVDVYEGASHTLPPVSLLFDSFMEELLGQETPASKPISASGKGDSESILYDVEPQIQLDNSSLKARSADRTVTDAEVADLQVFFKTVLSTAAPPKPAVMPNGAAHKVKAPARVVSQANGHKAKSTLTNGDLEEDGDREEVASDNKSRGKKRKAVKGN